MELLGSQLIECSLANKFDLFWRNYWRHIIGHINYIQSWQNLFWGMACERDIAR